jgi:hypothetical protein
MDQLREFLKVVREHGAARGNLLGLLHALIGRRITTADGTPVSAGMTWRDLANALKRERWEPEGVRELGLDPDALPPRDRYRFWYSAINQARVDSPTAAAAGDQLATAVRPLGYLVGPAPSAASPATPGPTPPERPPPPPKKRKRRN